MYYKILNIMKKIDHFIVFFLLFYFFNIYVRVYAHNIDVILLTHILVDCYIWCVN